MRLVDLEDGKKLERAGAQKVLRAFAKRVKSSGFVQKGSLFSRPAGHIIQFLSLHKFSFDAAFRIHACVRVVNDPLPVVALSGITSDATSFRTAFGYWEPYSVESCTEKMLEFVHLVAEPWFQSTTTEALLSEDSCLYPEARASLRAALGGVVDEKAAAATYALFGLA